MELRDWLAAATIHSGRKDSQRPLWTAASAGILLVSVLVAVGARGDNRLVLLGCAAHLVVATGILIRHSSLLRKVERALSSVR